jgi:hypothetical protein
LLDPHPTGELTAHEHVAAAGPPDVLATVTNIHRRIVECNKGHIAETPGAQLGVEVVAAFRC